MYHYQMKLKKNTKNYYFYKHIQKYTTNFFTLNNNINKYIYYYYKTKSNKVK